MLVHARAIIISTVRLIAIVSLVAVTTGYQNNVRTARINGIVIDGRTGDPVGGVQVSAEGTKPIFTDENGRFEFDDIPLGTLVLRTNKAGYLSAKAQTQTIPELERPFARAPTIADPYSLPSAAPIAAPKPGVPFHVKGELLQITLVTYKAPIVTGIVFDSEGQPVQGLLVFPLRYTYDQDGLWALQEDARSVRTDDRGEFRFNNLYPGDYKFRIAPPTLRFGEVRSRYYYSTYYPGTMDPLRAGIVTLTAGDETSLGYLTLMSGKAGLLRVRMINASGPQSRRPSTITVRRSGEATAIRSGTIGPGSFVGEIGELPLGTYEVQADIEKPEGRITAFVSIDVREGDNEVLFEVPNPMTVTAKAGINAPETGVVRPIPGIQVLLVPSFVGRPTILPPTGPNGLSVSMPSIVAGPYRVVIGGIPNGTYLASVRFRNLEILDKEVALDGKDEFNIEVVVGSPSGGVKGSVLDGKGQPVPGAVIALLPDDRTQLHRYIARTADQEGRYELETGPGAYHLYAWTEMDGSAYRNAEFMKPYDQFGVPLQVEKSGKIAIDLVTLGRVDTPPKN